MRQTRWHRLLISTLGWQAGKSKIQVQPGLQCEILSPGFREDNSIGAELASFNSLIWIPRTHIKSQAWWLSLRVLVQWRKRDVCASLASQFILTGELLVNQRSCHQGGGWSS